VLKHFSFSILFIFLFSLCAQAEGERMGIFRFSEFSLSPRGIVEEPSRGGFELKESWIGFEWSRGPQDQDLSGEISFGSPDLVEPAIWYAPITQKVELVTAAVKGKTDWMDIRAGLIPIPNGFEGAFPEWELSLPQTRVRRHRWFTKRDYGLELKASSQAFTTSLVVHNGESGPNTDQKMWLTSLWKYEDSYGYGALITAEVGNSGPLATSSSIAATPDEGFAFDPTDSAKFRHASLALYRKWGRHLILFEGGRGEIIQRDEKKPFGWGHADLCANLGGDLNILARYEYSQSDFRRSESIIRSYGLGTSVTSRDRLTSVTLWANKNQEQPERQNDEAMLIFRINSNAL
jgi:hypothetical protein